MAGIVCETAGACATTINNTCLAFSDQTPFTDATAFSLPSYLAITHSAQITEFPEHRVGGRKGTCGDFGTLGDDARKMNWIVTTPWCLADPVDSYLQHAECWNFRHYPDCCDITTYWELTGRVSFDTDIVFDNDLNDITVISFTIKGFADHSFVYESGSPPAAERTVGTGCTAPCAIPAGTAT